MNRILLIGLAALASWGFASAAASAQVFVRAPFVRVQTGPGVFIQAPFVRIAVPPAAPVYAPAPVYVLPPPSIYIPPTAGAAPPLEILPRPEVAPAPTPELQGPPVTTVVPPPPPPPLQGQVQAVTLEQFAANFKPRAGTFEVDLINPVTRQPAKVRFTLPQGTPKRVIVNRDEVVFRYGLLQFVRIEFTNSGAQVTTRLTR